MKRLWDSVFATSLGFLFSLTIAPAYAQVEDDAQADAPVAPKYTPTAPNMDEIRVTGTYI